MRVSLLLFSHIENPWTPKVEPLRTIQPKALVTMLQSIREMPVARIGFSHGDPGLATREKSRELFEYFTKRHRTLIVRNKTIGIALLDLAAFSTHDVFLKSIDGKNSAAYYARKAEKRGYRFQLINRNEFAQDIHDVNTSAEFRQGQRMSESYFEMQSSYVDRPGYKYFGVINENERLVAYCNVGFYGDFALIPELLGHSDNLNDGIMYYMLTQVVADVRDHHLDNGCRYVMYDTFVGASDGLRRFKRKLGFAPYRVKWVWNE